MAQREVDLPQLFSDVSRTISGISNIMGAGPSADEPSNPSAAPSSSASVMGGLFGNTCFKACGMEDVQYAARSAGDMLITLRTCILISTIVSVVCLAVLTGSVLYLVCRKAPPKRFPLPAFVKHVFPAKGDNNNKEESN